MAVRYDEALPLLLDVCESQPQFGNIETACVVRDLLGRLRLVCRSLPSAAEPDWIDLSQRLEQTLRGWFAPPILRTQAPRPEEARTAQALLRQRDEHWPAGWPTRLSTQFGQDVPLPERWCALTRVITKEAWLQSAPSDPPWPLLPGRRPVLVSFYSFKGGVGRTTALALTARRLALQGKRVLLVDLDLEAPGLAPFFGLTPAAGVIDVLLAHAATGDLNLDDLVHTVDARGVPLHVLPAGRLGWSYLEKLARLDYLHTAGRALSPVEGALRALLKAVRVTRTHDDGATSLVEPDYILLDARAGLHDIAGLALHGLSHADVLVSRANAQSREGLDVTLHALARRSRDVGERLILVHTFVPQSGFDAAVSEWRSELYALMKRHFYERESADDGVVDAPATVALTDVHAPHNAIPVPDLGPLGAPSDLSVADEALLNHSVWKECARRIEELTS
jgi:MinD-like ATPase involved in chromosome partitioning or flagellar assembly